MKGIKVLIEIVIPVKNEKNYENADGLSPAELSQEQFDTGVAGLENVLELAEETDVLDEAVIKCQDVEINDDNA